MRSQSRLLHTYTYIIHVHQWAWEGWTLYTHTCTYISGLGRDGLCTHTRISVGLGGMALYTYTCTYISGLGRDGLCTHTRVRISVGLGGMDSVHIHVYVYQWAWEGWILYTYTCTYISGLGRDGLCTHRLQRALVFRANVLCCVNYFQNSHI